VVGGGDFLAAAPPKNLHHQQTPQSPRHSEQSEESHPSLVDTYEKKDPMK